MSESNPSRGPVDWLDALRQSGDVGRDLTAVDWAATPLGDLAGWEHSLRTMVRVVVGSRFAMWMAWGPDLTFFCNDAYRRDTLATKYPWALGRPAAEVWEEIWDDIGPRITGVLETGEATWDQSLLLFLERNGYTEETYHTFSYSPLTDDTGEIAGMLCVVSEETERVIGERRMRTLRDVAAIEGGGREAVGYVREAAAALEASDRSLPFKLIYLTGEDGLAHLAGASGISPDHPAAPAVLDPADPDAAWPIAAAMAGEFGYVEGLDERFAELPAGAWSVPPRAAAVLPLPAQVAGDAAVGILIAGANQYRPLDASFRSFVELLAGQLASGVASANSFEATRRRAEDLAQLDAAKTTFFTNVSHELRTPLTLLLGPAEDMAGAGVERSENDERRLGLILGNAQRLLKLVNTLLDFSRLESGQTSALFEPVDLSTTTLELVSMFESALTRGGLVLKVDCPPLDRPVWVDRDMWSKIVFNLISNALKFTLEGTITVRIRAVDDERVRLEVADSGIGIPEADQAHLFERFHRVEGASARTHEGTGIGLALVAELVHAHGGNVSVLSTLGEGSTFGVELPFGPGQLAPERLAPEGAPAAGPADGGAQGYLAEIATWLPSEGPDTPGSGAPTSGDAGPAEGAAGVGSGPRILVVDDNADMRAYVTSLLSDAYAVITARDGVEGLRAAREHVPDLILTDVMMPRMDGFSLLTALRADPATVHVPVLMLSARAGEEGMIEGLEAGADDYLIKPFAARELLARVAANLELDRARRVRDQLHRGQMMQNQAERLALVGSWEIDFRTTTIRTSEQFRLMVGIEEEDLVSLDYRQAVLEFIDERDRDVVAASLQAGLQSGEPVRYEARLARSGHWMQARAETVYDDAGTAVGLRGFIQDITQRREAEQALAEAAAARKVAQREHAIADQLQRSLLPGDDLSNSRLQAAGFYRSGVEGTQAGGDFYDVIDLGATRTAIVIGDVSGRGVQAASLMGQLRAAIRALAHLDLPPAEVLEQLDTMVEELGRRSLVTCIFAIHDSAAGTLVYASAGHLPAILAEPGQDHPTLLPGPTGPPLGVSRATYAERTVDFPVGATLVLYTDGLVERRRMPIDANIDQLARAVAAYRGSLDELPQALVDALGADGIDDDVAILAICSLGAVELQVAERALEPYPTEVRNARRFAVRTLEEWGISGVVVQDATTVVSELATNAIIYGRPPLRLRLRVDADELVIEMEDALSALPRRGPVGGDAPRGRGLRIVAQLAQQWNARATGAGKTVWCSLRLPASSRREPRRVR
jgi:PAS domain S-box-containing protein